MAQTGQQSVSVGRGGSVAITGCGWITPFAAGSIADVLGAAESAVAPDGPFWAVADDRVTEYPDLSKEIRRDKGSWLAAIAWEHAVRGASLDIGSLDAERVGLVLGCSLAGQLGMIDFAGEVRKQSPRFVSPIHFPQTVGNYPAGALARGYGLRGPSVTLASGTSSSLDGLVEACRVLDRGEADVVVAGGVETWSEGLATAMAIPGVALSEGACLLVLEKTEHAQGRGVKPLAIVAAWGTVACRSGDGDPSGSATGDAGRALSFVSASDEGAGGDIAIEQWIGRCPGAAGAAAVAAAIGAGAGRGVPISNGQCERSASGTVLDLSPANAATEGGAGAQVMRIGIKATGHDCAELIVEISAGAAR